MKIEEIKKYTHMHKIQEFLDTDKGSVQIHKLNGDLCFVVSCDILKTYIENIYITGLVSKYGEDGRPVGLCKASKLYYVTTAGGPYEGTYSYDYIKDLAVGAFGIKDTELIYAEMLDIAGNDPEKILDEVIDIIEKK